MAFSPHHHTSEHYYWKKDVLETCNYTCWISGKTKEEGANLSAHHIFSAKHNEHMMHWVSNGIALEGWLHKLFHSWLGGSWMPCDLEDLLEFKDWVIANDIINKHYRDA